MKRFMYALKIGIISMMINCTMWYIIPSSVIHAHTLIYALVYGLLVGVLILFLLEKPKEKSKNKS
ncbi:hypothetical protein [Staphylococcus carnosus]|uniref:hypothetical protein n=1 Tax=Staphylococcus carnosus TaxID=1281 RepID=UPI000B0BB454|nr:hypothetical protein [Staphylococcus carnosus]HDE7734270.1 hypothetical protein [Staphylococcus aureus]QRQ06282.1 hypothetical protein I6J34_06585 [Staphylococcus carnosus]UTB84001.1 hypothetical protein A2I67_12440 [Staphylococcus carnosus]SUM04705.1 Uncharacterised protein [Staphylococcus carnosus]GEP80742.1 hypothetical protein SCA05_25350 [Staphylococcus carnosus]